jgi:hypothetical protein
LLGLAKKCSTRSVERSLVYQNRKFPTRLLGMRGSIRTSATIIESSPRQALAPSTTISSRGRWEAGCDLSPREADNPEGNRSTSPNSLSRLVRVRGRPRNVGEHDARRPRLSSSGGPHKIRVLGRDPRLVVALTCPHLAGVRLGISLSASPSRYAASSGPTIWPLWTRRIHHRMPGIFRSHKTAWWSWSDFMKSGSSPTNSPGRTPIQIAGRFVVLRDDPGVLMKAAF